MKLKTKGLDTHELEEQARIPDSHLNLDCMGLEA